LNSSWSIFQFASSRLLFLSMYLSRSVIAELWLPESGFWLACKAIILVVAVSSPGFAFILSLRISLVRLFRGSKSSFRLPFQSVCSFDYTSLAMCSWMDVYP
jgi:hypothetical protein